MILTENKTSSIDRAASVPTDPGPDFCTDSKLEIRIHCENTVIIWTKAENIATNIQ